MSDSAVLSRRDQIRVPDRDALNPLTAARGLRPVFAVHAATADTTGAFPFAHFHALHDAGLLRLSVAKSSGGHGATLEEARQVVREIAMGEASTALVLTMHLVNHAEISRGDTWPDHLARLLVDSTRHGVALVNRLQVEPEAGSPTYGTLPRTRAERVAGGWLINGRKKFSTGAPMLAWMVINAVTDEPAPRVGSFVVPGDAPGVRVIETWDMIGMRASGSHDVAFENVVVPLDHGFEFAAADAVIKRDEITTVWFLTLIGAVYDGVARAARDHVLGFTEAFHPGGLTEPLSALPRIRDELGAIEVLLDTNDRLLGSLAHDVEAGQAPAGAALMIRHVVIENSVRAVDLALGVAGNRGLARSGPLERHHRDVICGRTHAPAASLMRQTAAARAIDRLRATRL